MSTLIIAACNGELIQWSNALRPAWNVFACYDFHPEGREAYVYLEYIVSHYADLDGDYVFCQGEPREHDTKFLEHLEDPVIRYYGYSASCDPLGLPHCGWTPMHSWCDVLGLPKLLEYKFVAGAQYRVDAGTIRCRSREFYWALLNLATIKGNKSAWVLERLWPMIWGIEL